MLTFKRLSTLFSPSNQDVAHTPPTKHTRSWRRLVLERALHELHEAHQDAFDDLHSEIIAFRAEFESPKTPRQKRRTLETAWEVFRIRQHMRNLSAAIGRLERQVAASETALPLEATTAEMPIMSGAA
ncbi:MAG: hypothetical protein SGI86_03005 [Deltaproteobacteria bacterium]|nr:hypothetical protein [Deltaproteobacteria bacterium]